jgi:branched-chain amino acid transport system ATP-binding protein
VVRVLKLENVESGYSRQVLVLRGVSLEVPAGKIVTLLGSNGAGKSTTLKTIMGLIEDEPRKGRVTFEGNDLTRRDTERIARAGIALVPEGRGMFKDLTVLENLMLGAYHHTRSAADTLRDVFTRFPRLEERKSQHAGTLSGGEQQMLAIGRALMSRPKLVLLDEPSLGLAPKFVQEIFSVIQAINVEGVSVLLIEQNARQALEVAHHGYVLENGRVVLEGSAQALKDNENVKELYLGLAQTSDTGVGRYRRKRRWN